MGASNYSLLRKRNGKSEPRTSTVLAVNACMPGCMDDSASPPTRFRPYIGRQPRAARWVLPQLRDVGPYLLIFGIIGGLVIGFQASGHLFLFTGVVEAAIAFAFALFIDATLNGGLNRAREAGEAMENLGGAVNDTVMLLFSFVSEETVRTQTETQTVSAFNSQRERVSKKRGLREALEDTRMLAKAHLLAFNFASRGTLDNDQLPLNNSLIAEISAYAGGAVQGITAAIYSRANTISALGASSTDPGGLSTGAIGAAGSAMGVISLSRNVKTPAVIAMHTSIFTWFTMVLIAGTFFEPLSTSIIGHYGPGAVAPITPGDPVFLKWLAALFAWLLYLAVLFLYFGLLSVVPHLKAPFESASVNRYLSFSTTDQALNAARDIDSFVDEYFRKVDHGSAGGSAGPVELDEEASPAPARLSYHEDARWGAGNRPDYV